MEDHAPEDQTGNTVALLLTDLKADRKTCVVDVGANPINEAPYSDLLRAGGCTVVGFEPQQDAFEALLKTKTDAETYYPFAVGDGKPATLKIFKFSGMTSIFEPNVEMLKAMGIPGMAKVRDRVVFDTVALDSVADLPEFDLLKIDIQGGEALVFQGAKRLMADCVVVIVELRYLQLYLGEPMMGGVDSELRRHGFGLHRFMFNRTRALPNSQSARLKNRFVKDQLIDGDGVYIRNIAQPEKLSDQQFIHLAILAASVFHSHSLVLFCLDELVRRGVAQPDLPGRYVDLLPENLRAGH